MKGEFLVFEKFNKQNLAINFAKLLEENKIEYLIENISVKFDPILSNNEFGKEFCVKLKKNDFEKADNILSEKSKTEINEVQKDHYLFSFSDEQLIDVIVKSDEWNKFDVELSRKILKDKGKEISETEIIEIKKKRLIELAKPEESQNIYIVIGYICAILGGILGLFIGWHLLTFKKTLPNGNRVYAYSENDRKQGNRIVILGGIFMIFWILYRILKYK